MSEFLATARIIVRPDTTAFRTELEAQLRAVTSTPIRIPVVASVAPNVGNAANAAASAAAAATAGSQAVAAAAQEAGAAAQAAAASTVRLSTVQKAAAVAAQKLAFAQSEVIGASSAVAAAQVTLTRSSAALAAAQKAVQVALTSNNAAMVTSTEETLALAAAQQVAAKTALADARAEASLAATRRQAIKGIFAQTAATLGLRAGTLAASTGFIAATVGVLGFVKAVQSAAQLETELNVFKVTAGATADEMDRVAASAKQLGRDITLPGVTANTAATAMTELAKAGLDVRDSISGARGALQLATAAQIDITTSTTLVANALNAFGLEGKDAVRVADLLAGAAKSAQGEIGEFGTGLGQVASVADQFGVSVEDTVTLLTQLAKAGLQGGRAGTTLRVAILGLIKPTAAASKALERLEKFGVKVTDAFGNFNPTAFAQINEALKNFSKEEQNVIRNTIFSSDAIKVLGRATAGGVSDFNEINDAVSKYGLAQEAAAARTSGLGGSFENLSNQVGSLGLEIGNIAKGPVKALVDALAAEVGVMTDTVDAVVTITGEIKKFGDQLVTTIPYIDDFKDALDGAFGGDGGGAGESIKKGILGGLNLLPSVLIKIASKFKDAEKDGAKLNDILKELEDASGAATFGLTKLSAKIPDIGLGVKQVQNIIVGFDAQETRARIKSDNAKLLDVLNEEQDFLEKQLTRDYVKRRPALQRAIEQALLGTVNDIEAVQSQAKSKAESVRRDAKKAAADAAAAVKDREQALLSSFGLARDQRQNRISLASQTQGLQDDIKAQQSLKALVLKQIAAVRERISVEGGRKAAVVALKAVLIQVNGALADLQQQQQAAAEERRQAALQTISLDVELAQITENQAAEVVARNKKIGVLEQALKREAQLHGKTTVAYKEIRNQIAAERAAIEDIRKEKQKENNSFAQASFEFLQAQQGFASTLLGNLIPRGATGGLVGGGAPVQTALQPVTGAAEARSMSGVTAGQGNATNHLLTQILWQLKELNGEQKAPEARRQMGSQLSTMDGVGGG